MTLGDLLGQDGAFALLAIGAALGFLAAVFFRGFDKGRADTAQPLVSAAPKQASAAGVIAAITAAVNKYQSEHTHKR